MMWGVATLSAWLLLASVTAEDRMQCDFCVCQVLRTRDTEQPTDSLGSLTNLYLNCSNTGNEPFSAGKQVLIPTLDYGKFKDYYIWAEFRRNNITKVHILNLSLIAKLYLDENNIEVIYDNAFHNMAETLTELSLTHNKLQDIKFKVFEPLNKLQMLDMSYNSLEEFNVDDFNLKDALKTLVLASNQIASINNSGTHDLSALESLDLSFNQLVEISNNNFLKLVRLSSLNLSHNRIQSIKSNAFKPLTALKSLDLSHNSISTLDVTPVKTVKQLKIGHNNVGELHKVMKIFPNIEELSAENNGIQSLNATINVDLLQVLNLSGNTFSEFPPRSFPKLQNLDLSSNSLTSVPTGLNGKLLPALRTLSLDDNPLREVLFSTAEAPFKELRRLSLCRLRDLQALGEAAFPQLMAAGAGTTGSMVTRTRGGADPDCGGRLELVAAQNPKLTEVHQAALKDIKLCELDLSYNALTSLPEDLVPWEQVPTVDLQGNPWNCQCGLQWLLNRVVGNIYEKGDRRLLVELRCASPALMRDRRLVHFYNWTMPALCGGENRLSRYRSAEKDVDVSVTTGSSEGMLIAISVLGAMFLALMVAGLVVHFRNESKRRNRNRRF